MVLAFTFVVSLVTGIIFGLLPALHGARQDIRESLAEGSRGATVGPGGQRLRRLLVVSEVAVALVLVVGAGLFIKSFWRLQNVDPGFNAAGLLTARLMLPSTSYPESSDVAAFFEELVERLGTVSGVTSSAAVSNLPLAGINSNASFNIEGSERAEGETWLADYRVITRDYFNTMNAPLLMGRPFGQADDARANGVVIINETMAKRYWLDSDPIGARIRLRDDHPWLSVVGIIGDFKHEDLSTASRPEMFFPRAQPGSHFSLGPRRAMSVVLRTNGDPLSYVGPLRRELAELDGNIPLSGVRSVKEVVSDSISSPRFTTLVLSIFASLALLLGAVGIYSVISYGVTQRRREMGIRSALGAREGAILRMVVGQGLIMVATGIGVGLLLTVALTRLVTNLLYQVSPTDPLTIVLVSSLLSVVAVLASYIPARRASRVDPVITLRAE